MHRRIWPLWIYYAIAAFVFLLDYVTKKLIEFNLKLYEQIEIIGNFFLLTSIRNRGAAFGILQGQRWFFVLVTVIVVVGLAWYFKRSHRTGNRLLMIALSMILGGAVGNFLDRAIYGEVVDFLQFNFGSYTFPIFNVADSGICVGVALVILDSLRSIKQENKDNGNEEKGNSLEEQQSV